MAGIFKRSGGYRKLYSFNFATVGRFIYEYA